jgi:hypothetical protein
MRASFLGQILTAKCDMLLDCKRIIEGSKFFILYIKSTHNVISSIKITPNNYIEEDRMSLKKCVKKSSFKVFLYIFFFWSVG